MEQQPKRLKSTNESIVADIASTINHIADSLKSMSETYGNILKVNKTIVTYLRDVERRKNEVNVNQTIENLQHTSIGKEQ